MTSWEASSVLCRMNSWLPENTAISPVAALRRWAMIGALGSFELPSAVGAAMLFAAAPPDTFVTAPAIWPGMRTAPPTAAATAPDRAINALLLIGSNASAPFLNDDAVEANVVQSHERLLGVRSQDSPRMIAVALQAASSPTRRIVPRPVTDEGRNAIDARGRRGRAELTRAGRSDDGSCGSTTRAHDGRFSAKWFQTVDGGERILPLADQLRAESPSSSGFITM
jgi:hypothetical protein